VVASIVRGRRDPRLRYLVYSCNDGVHRQEIEEAGATVRIIPRSLPKIDPFWVHRLARALRADGIQLLHAHLFGDSLHGLLAARRAGGLPVVLTLHIGPKGWNRLQRLVYPRLITASHRAVACAESVRANIERAHPAAGRAMGTLHNGIETPVVDALPEEQRHRLLASLGVPPDAVTLATVGRHSEQKGYPYLLSAFAALRRERPHDPTWLVLLGDGELRGELEAQAAREGAGDRIVFAGFRDNVGDLLRALDIVAFSSLFEGLPIALLEAMAAGRALVVSDIPGNLDAVRPNTEALVVPTGEVEGLHHALERITTDAALRRRLGEAARQRFLDEFTAEAMVGRYEELYRGLLHPAHGG
jgi:glycosyltransferase involved in cell wall biosynthesis